MDIVVMGVTGSGKSTVGRLLAERFGFRLYEGDEFHSPENIRKMSCGTPLKDEDRRPWLERLRLVVQEDAAHGGSAVVCCSALKEAYRRILSGPDTRFVYLKASPELVRARLRQRTAHFMPASLVDSQFADLEEPNNAIVVNAAIEPQAIVEQIAKTLGLA